MLGGSLAGASEPVCLRGVGDLSQPIGVVQCLLHTVGAVAHLQVVDALSKLGGLSCQRLSAYRL